MVRQQGVQRGQGGPARQQTDRPERRSEPRPARDLLPPRQLGRTLPAEEVCKRAQRKGLGLTLLRETLRRAGGI